MADAPLTGQRFGVYQLQELIGAGGMGHVYRARDTKLGRDVAIKILPRPFTSDPERLARFDREARVLASLNHPHIGTIYGFEEVDGLRGLVLELVAGQTVADRLASGPIPLAESLTIARQIADALEAAHESGIVHRDLKPANIKITPAGVVKVLDFGLAKVATDAASGTNLTAAPTMTMGGTREGLILGTAAYMSPEQARGQVVDKRTDVWAFGAVLYQMLTGRAPFQGDTVSDTIAAILERQPQWDTLPAETPATIRRLLQRCLEKDPKRRLHDVADARIEIDDALTTPAATPSQTDTDSPRRRGVPLSLAAAVAALVAVGAAVGGWLLKPSAVVPAQTVSVQRLTDLVGLEETPAISPDGKTVAFVSVSGGRRQIWVRLLGGGSTLAVTKDDEDHYGPRWSPDSASLIYYTSAAQPGEPGTLWEIPALGGSARRLLTALGPGDISHDGKSIAFLRFSDGVKELAVAARDLSTIRSIVKLETTYDTNLRWSPDDRLIAYLAEAGASNFSNNLMVVDASGGTPRQVAGDLLFRGFTWIPDGSGLIASSAQGSTMAYPPTQNLWTYPLSGGSPTQLTFGESSYEFPDASVQGNLSVSRLRTQSDVWRFPVAGDPVENALHGTRITRQTGLVQTLTVSPDETEVAFLSDNGGHANVWIARVADGEMRPLTHESDPRFVVAVPHWAPKGGLINFLSNRNSGGSDVTLWVAQSDGSDLRDLGVRGAWACWSGDARWIYYSVQEKGTYYIRKVPAAGGQPVAVRDDNAVGCSLTSDASTMYYLQILTQATGAWDFAIRVAKPENAPSTIIGRVAGSRVPVEAVNLQLYLSPDEKWLAVPLMDGSTTNLWALPVSGGEWKKLTDFSRRNVVIARRIGWSRDGKSLYAAVGDVDSDIVMLTGLRW